MFEMLFIAASDLIIPVTYGYAGLLFVVVTCAYPHRMPRPLFIRRCVQYVRSVRVCHTRFPDICVAAYCIVLYCFEFQLYLVTCVYVRSCGLYSFPGVRADVHCIVHVYV